MKSLAHLPTDEHLPQLGVAADAEAMQEILRQRFPDFLDREKWQLMGMNVKQFHHRAGRKCEVTYALHFHNRVTGEWHRQTLFAMVLPNGATETQFVEERQRRYFQPEIGLGVHVLPELGMILWGFPNDPRLCRLHELVNTATLRELLRKHWGGLKLPSDFSLTSIATDVIKYVPQDRCTLKHCLQLQNADHAKSLILFSKTYSHKTAGAPIFEILQELWNAPVSQSGALIVPEPLFYERELNAVFQRGMAGQNLDELLHEIDLDSTAGKIGAALAGIHQSAVPTSNYRSRQGEMLEFADGMQALCRFNSDYQPPLETINETLWSRLPALTPLVPVPIHGAFRLSQLLMTDGKIGLVDFDGFLNGDPIADIGSFVAHLLYLVVKGDLSTDQSRSAIRRFCRSYAEHAPWRLPADVLEWYTTVMLIGKQAKKCVKVARNNHAVKVEQLVNWASAIIDGKERLM